VQGHAFVFVNALSAWDNGSARMTATPLSVPTGAGLPTTPEPTTPRHGLSWARRHKFATAVLSLITFALLLRLAWGWYAARQLAAAMEELRRRGQPTTPGDTRVESIPDGENAWLAYAAAVRKLKPGVDSPRNSALEYPAYPPFGAPWERLAKASETANGAAFAAARAARRLPRSQFPPVPQPGNRPQWNQARTLANNLEDGALYAHLRGDDAEAVERLLDVLHLARSVRQEPEFVGQLVAVGLDALGAFSTQQVVPTLRLDAADGGTPATREQARALIDALLDERDDRAAFARTLPDARAAMLESLNRNAGETWAIRPLADRTAVRWLRDFDTLIDAAEHLNGAQSRQKFQTVMRSVVPFPYVPPVRYSRWFEGNGPIDLARGIEQFHRGSAERRMTAVIVAARLYRQDHGRWPEDAAALVPKYLDAIPADPFREDGGPIGYVLKRGALPDGGDRPLVYSETGEIGGGDVIDTEPMYGWQVDRNRAPGTPFREIRQYRDVSLWMPPRPRFSLYPPASTQAVGNNANEPDAPGDDANDDDGASDAPAKR
jgi:hypothetical protein